MVNKGEALDATFAALSDPTRRGILEQLSRGETNVTALAQPYRMSLPAVSKHLRVLERAGLITRARAGREHRIRVDPTPLQGVRDWISLYSVYWQEQFDALDAYLEQAQKDAAPAPPRKEKN